MSLKRHTKECSNELASHNVDLNDVDMLREENDSDMSESCESNDDYVNDTPTHCYGTA